MKFLEMPPRFLFFTGKGGVGKTSIACATAVQLAGLEKQRSQYADALVALQEREPVGVAALLALTGSRPGEE
jgi:DNA replication protein DnaC